MKTLAIVSSYNELCGNATYAEVLRKGFSKYYETTVLPLRQDLLRRERAFSFAHSPADEHIKRISSSLAAFDYVNIQFEAGLYGVSPGDIIRRVGWLMEASRNVVLTMHRVDVYTPHFYRAINELLRRRSLGSAHEMLASYYRAKISKGVINNVKRLARTRRINIMVHTRLDRKKIRDYFGLENNVCVHPITFMNEEQRSVRCDDEARREFKIRRGFKREDVIIGLFGFVSAYKNYGTVINALSFLPEKYKVAIFGAQHPMSISANTPIDAYLEKLLALVEKRRVTERVKFFGSLSDEALISALHCCDFAVLPYMETNQSGSGIAALTIESGVRMLSSNTKCSAELAKFYPGCFEIFDIGNYLELGHKIANWSCDLTANLDSALKVWNMENNISLHRSIFEGGSPVAANIERPTG